MATKGEIVVRRALWPGHHSGSRASNNSDETDHANWGQRSPMDRPENANQYTKIIAIVDDEEELARLFQTLLRNQGYNADYVAHDGDEIVKAVLDGIVIPDLIIMDYRMPSMNGLQAAQRILRFRPETRIIIASADDSIKQDAHSAGLTYLQKPFSISILTRSIRAALGLPNPK